MLLISFIHIYIQTNTLYIYRQKAQMMCGYLQNLEAQYNNAIEVIDRNS